MLSHIAPRYVRMNPINAHVNHAVPPVMIRKSTPPMLVNFQRTGCLLFDEVCPAIPLIPLKKRVTALTIAKPSTNGPKNDAIDTQGVSMPPAL